MIITDIMEENYLEFIFNPFYQKYVTRSIHNGNMYSGNKTMHNGNKTNI